MVGIRGRKFCRLGSSILWLVKCIRGEKYTQVFSAVRRGSVYIYASAVVYWASLIIYGLYISAGARTNKALVNL